MDLASIVSFPILSGETGISVILPTMVEFVPMLIAFIVVAIVLYKFGWPLYEKMLETRKTKISDSLKESEKKLAEAERLLEKYKKQLEEANKKCDQMIAEAKLSANDISAQIQKDAKDKADATSQKAKLSIAQEKKVAEQEIKENVTDVAVCVCKKVIDEGFDHSDHMELIKKYVKESNTIKG